MAFSTTPRAAKISIPPNSSANAASAPTNALGPLAYPNRDTAANTIIPTQRIPHSPIAGAGPIWRVAGKQVLYLKFRGRFLRHLLVEMKRLAYIDWMRRPLCGRQE